MSVGDKARNLLELAKSRSPDSRERLLMAVADLCDTARDSGALDVGGVRDLLNDIFQALVIQAEHDIRRRLAEKLAKADWAPPALINVLALDEIEIARPVIACSPLLQDRDLIRLLVEASIDHQIEIARRPMLSAIVADAILTQEEPAVLTALASNETADITPTGLAKLVDASRRTASLRDPLARHPRLTEDLAQRLYLWVGQSLRTAIAGRFRMEASAFDPMLGEAIRDAYSRVSDDPVTPPIPASSPEQEEMERRLIGKLHAAGQLRPGYLLRALREQKLGLFEAAMGKLGGLGADDVRRALDADTPDLLGMACASVGLDRSVFPTVLGLVRKLNGGRPLGDPEAGMRATDAFAPHPPDVAATAFRHASTL